MILNIKPVILCGGVGTRLWPLSRESFPKQFSPLLDGKSLLSHTLERISNFSGVICVTNENYRFLVKDEISKSSISEYKILLETMGRNTAGAMALVSYMAGLQDSDLLLFLPSDHYIPEYKLFTDTIEKGVNSANAGYIVTFGVKPTFPSSAYGYILQGLNVDINARCVDSFIEKPEEELAKKLITNGNYLWNAGIFLVRVDVLRESISKFSPNIGVNAKNSMKEITVDGVFIRPNEHFLKKTPSMSFDHAVVEKSDKIAVVPFNGSWSDLGSWSAVAEIATKDSDGNGSYGKGNFFKSKNTYIHNDGRQVVTLGTHDLVIVNTADVLLVANKNYVEDVKGLVTSLRDSGAPETNEHRKVLRPWGWYDLIESDKNFKVKRILVKVGASISMQLHNHRSEHWIVVKGVAKVTKNDEIFILKENESTYIPISVKHRLENCGDDDLEIIEVQSGLYLDEDDIIRFDDLYGRTK
jgi:mannose-1-phosphate guanylyltransferase/mannose-6-phosphate isomerase